MHAFLFKKQWEAVLLGAAGSTAGQGLQGPPRNQAARAGLFFILLSQFILS